MVEGNQGQVQGAAHPWDCVTSATLSFPTPKGLE